MLTDMTELTGSDWQEVIILLCELMGGLFCFSLIVAVVWLPIGSLLKG